MASTAGQTLGSTDGHALELPICAPSTRYGEPSTSKACRPPTDTSFGAGVWAVHLNTSANRQITPRRVIVIDGRAFNPSNEFYERDHCSRSIISLRVPCEGESGKATDAASLSRLIE